MFEVADLLKVSRTEDDFLLELHPKLGPVEAAVGGVYMAGSVRGLWSRGATPKVELAPGGGADNARIIRSGIYKPFP